MMVMAFNVWVGVRSQMNDMLMNQFRLFQDPSFNVCSETMMAFNDTFMDRIVWTIQQEVFWETDQTKSSAGPVIWDAQPDTSTDVVTTT